MSKVTYSSLKLKQNNKIIEVDFNGIKIEVLNYLSIEDKYNLIMLALQNSKLENIYNPIKLDMYFHLYLVYMYTNLSFTEKQREDESKLFDTLQTNGLIDLIVENIPEEEYDQLYNLLLETQDKKEKYEKTIGGILNNLLESMKINSDEIQNLVNNFDREQFQNVLSFAKAANGGRNID